jgi:transcription antitermination protein NusB
MNKNKNNDDLNQLPVNEELDQLDEQTLQEEEEQEILNPINLTTDSRRDERFVSFYLVYAADRFEYSVDLDNVVDNFKNGFDVKISKKSFAYKLAQGAIDMRQELDEQLRPFLKNWKLERLGCCTRLILRIALWELTQKEAIPSVIINEAVELSKVFAEKDAYKFINGVLDEYCKVNNIKDPDIVEKVEAK